MIYILTGDKKGDTYQYIFNVVKFYFDQNCPVETGTIMIDFEKAVMNAIQNSLPGWEISNCYFHLCQVPSCPSAHTSSGSVCMVQYLATQLGA